LPIFKQAVKDIKSYVSKAHFDRNFITVGFLFCKEIMPYVDHDLMQSLIKRAVGQFDFMTPAQVSYICLNSHMLHDKDDRNRRCKIELFKRLDEYLIKNESKFMSSDKLINRKTA
jgi:hypothetical protein